jgi:hypothetical protein
MEIQEIVSYYLFEDSRKVEVSFRLTTDSEDEIRNDIVDVDEAKDFGYILIEEELDDLFIDDDDSEFYDDGFMIVDEIQLLDFLNEYYIVNPNQLPKTDLI